MNKARNIVSIISLLIFIVIAGMIFIIPARAKKQAFKLSFSGTVISTLEGEKRDRRITVEIVNGDSRCYIVVSHIKERKLYPQYHDSIFKDANSDIMYLKKDKQTKITTMEGISCLNIYCREENQR